MACATLMRKIAVGIVLVAFLLLVLFQLTRRPPSISESFDFMEHAGEATQQTPNPVAQEEEILFRETFEEGNQPPRWVVNSWHGEARGERTSQTSQEGQYAFVLQDERNGGRSEGADADVAWTIPVEGLSRYSFQGYVRPENLQALGARLHGTFYLWEFATRDAGSQPLESHTSMASSDGTLASWKRLEYSFITKPETRWLTIAGSLGNYGRATGRVFFDNLSLKKISFDVAPVHGLQVGEYRLRDEVRPGLGVPAPSSLDYALTVPPEAVLEMAVGVPTSERVERVPLAFQVSVLHGGKEEIVFYKLVSAGDPWADERISFDHYAGETLQVRFSVRRTGENQPNSRGAAPVACWANPVLRQRSAQQDKPSVVWISIDTLRGDHVGHLGYPRETTPNLDRLATTGVTFSSASSPAPWTLPAHASMFTAAFPLEHRADDRVGLRRDLVTAAEVFARAGYFCGSFVSHFYLTDKFGLNRGFHTSHWEQDARASSVVDRALSWLQERKDRPTFLFLHLFDPHWDYAAPGQYRSMFDPDYAGTLGGDYAQSILPFKDPHRVPPARDLEHLVALYDGEIRYVDDQIGRLVEGLGRLGLDERTIVVVTSDHGEEFREHGSMGHAVTLFEEVLHVPLLFFGKPLGLSPRVVATPVQTLDILPTLAELLGLPVRDLPAHGGASLVPLMTGRSSEEIHPAFASTDRFDASKQSVRTGSQKLIWDLQRGTLAFFDLGDDPGESRDLAGAQPQGVMPLQADLEGFGRILEESYRQRGQKRLDQIQLDPEQEKLLRSLGYVQ